MGATHGEERAGKVCRHTRRTESSSQPAATRASHRASTRGPDVSDDLSWLAALSPWPEDGFGLERMTALLAALDDPQRRYPAVHVVGTNRKSTATLTIVGAGTADITSKQLGDANTAAAPDVTRTLVVAKAASTVTLGNLAATYDGTGRITLWRR